MVKTMNKRQELEQLMDVCLARYNEGDTVKPKDTINIIKILADDTLPQKTINNVGKNFSKYKPDNILYHLLRIIPKLFIASLHCDPPVDPDTLCPISGHNFKTKFLSRRLQEPLDEISKLEKKLDEERDNNHFDEMMDYKNQNKELKEQEKILKDHIARLEEKIKFKDEMLETRVPKQALEIRDKRIKDLEKQIDNLNQK
jgi:hypothetical protein